jgi:hypothetical protein
MVLKRDITEKQNNNVPTKKAKKRDHNKPRNVRPPFQFYTKLNRERIYAEHECINAAEVMKKCIEEWNALGATGRKKVHRHVRRGQEAPHLGGASISRQS